MTIVVRPTCSSMRVVSGLAHSWKLINPEFCYDGEDSREIPEEEFYGCLLCGFVWKDDEP